MKLQLKNLMLKKVTPTNWC